MNRRSSGQIVAVVVLLLLVAFIVGSPGSDGPPLDPDSVGELGTLGLVEFLERSGAAVGRGVPGPGSDVDVTLVLADRLDGGTRERLLDWVQDGGHVVVADPTSPLVATGLLGTLSGDDLDRGECGIADLAEVNRLAGSSLAVLVPVPNSTTCFGDDQGAYVLRFEEQAGQVTALGGAIPFVNRQLDKEDNAVLAARLLLSDDEPSISIVFSTTVAAGGQSPLQLVGRNVWWFILHLGVVAFVGVLWAIRRFGPVVHEPAVVELPGSLVVRSTAELHRRSETPERSEEAILRAIRQRIRAEFSLPPEIDPHHGAAVVAEHSGVSINEAATLTGAVAAPGENPLERVKELDRIGRIVFGEPTPALPMTQIQPTLTIETAPTTEEPANV